MFLCKRLLDTTDYEVVPEGALGGEEALDVARKGATVGGATHRHHLRAGGGSSPAAPPRRPAMDVRDIPPA